MNGEDAALAARLANGESLPSVLRWVRYWAWNEAWVKAREDSITLTGEDWLGEAANPHAE